VPEIQPHCDHVKCACDKDSKYSRVDGVCNNLQEPYLGAVGTEFDRLLGPSNYVTRLGSGNSFIKDTLPNPRELSLSLLTGVAEGAAHPTLNVDTNHTMMAAMFYAFTMFDMSYIPKVDNLDCCGANAGNDECLDYEVLNTMTMAATTPTCEYDGFTEANVCCEPGAWGDMCEEGCGMNEICVPDRGGLGRCKDSQCDNAAVNCADMDCYRDATNMEDVCFCAFGSVLDGTTCVEECTSNADCAGGQVCIPDESLTGGLCRTTTVAATCGVNGIQWTDAALMAQCSCPVGHISTDASSFRCYEFCTTDADCPNSACEHFKPFAAKVCTIPDETCTIATDCDGGTAVCSTDGVCLCTVDADCDGDEVCLDTDLDGEGECRQACSTADAAVCTARTAECGMTELLKPFCYCDGMGEMFDSTGTCTV